MNIKVQFYDIIAVHRMCQKKKWTKECNTQFINQKNAILVLRNKKTAKNYGEQT